MAVFEELFFESKGKPICYKGQTLIMRDGFPLENAKKVRVIFEECNGNWRQGISLDTVGRFLVNGQESASVVLWQDTAPRAVELELLGNEQEFDVTNVWDVGDGVMHSWHNGAAMIAEVLPNGRRYRCNDGFADDDFDDIVFRIERVE